MGVDDGLGGGGDAPARQGATWCAGTFVGHAARSLSMCAMSWQPMCSDAAGTTAFPATRRRSTCRGIPSASRSTRGSRASHALAAPRRAGRSKPDSPRAASGDRRTPPVPRRVLQQDESRSNCAYDCCCRGPHPPLVFDAELLAREAEWLAWEACADKVDGGPVLSCPPSGGGDDVVMLGYSWPVAVEDHLTERVDLNLTDSAESGTLETELEAADPCEQREHRRLAHATHHAFTSPSSEWPGHTRTVSNPRSSRVTRVTVPGRWQRR